jgi:hypothetical protein
LVVEKDKSALIVLVPEVESLVGDFRRTFDISGTYGLGAHVTVLFPFLSPDSFSAEVIGSLRALFAVQPRFDFSLTSVGGFPSVIYLVPEPRALFESLTQAAVLTFPDCLPYDGAFPNPVPHLTVAQQPPAEDLSEVGDRIRSRVTPCLPLRCAANEIALAVKRFGHWSIAERFALGEHANGIQRPARFPAQD